MTSLPSAGRIWIITPVLALMIVLANTAMKPRQVETVELPSEWSLPAGVYVTLDPRERRLR